MSMFKSFINDESGATAIEYGLIAGLIAVGLVTALGGLRNNIASTFNSIGGKLSDCSDGTC
jgi:pilus assembly protein Flp/PilA